jgi:uncharacterized protein (TIGR02284 family)
MQATHELMDCLNELLRGELSATETYQQAMAKVGNELGAAGLRQLRDDHRTAANALRQHIHEHGGQPDQDSGAWGYFAKAVEGSAKVFGNAAAMKALKEGEEHGVKLYEDALEDASLPEECKALIRSKLLPQTRAHIATLDRLMSRQ